ncbi:MAG TPA: VWA domain-containing protein, partial [Pyrinomonadaceae bacterium]|nr:VWA domain-containing protein [Pyrinomonadaceae bacterium]
MPVLIFSVKLFLLALLLFCFSINTLAQDQSKPPEQNEPVIEQEDDIVRIDTNLIQTGVAVFDKKGQFVDNLKQEDFQLRVDGKPVSISFFERVAAESDDRKIRLKQNIENKIEEKATPSAVNRRGRIVIFVVDDLHLSFDSHRRAKDLVLKFLERGIEPDDLIAVVSSSGKIGFLQQFTNDKAVLRAAVERLKYTKDMSATDRMNPPMSEYEAQLIDRYDPEVTKIFVDLILRDFPNLDREVAEEQVRSRARIILGLAATISKSTYTTLEQVVRRSAQLPGRKVVFFISDGFLLDPVNTDSLDRLRRIADTAIRANAVIYSFDAKGLEADSDLPDEKLKSLRVKSGGRFEAQDGLDALAHSTGGRFIRNTNDLNTGITKALA